MTVPVHWIDAFTRTPFGGNPAVVCLLPAPGRAPAMQALAAEFGVSETVFVAPDGSGGYRIRWWTPAVEIDLCGHGTLAAAGALAAEGRAGPGRLRLASRSGPLAVEIRGDGTFVLDFPARPPSKVAAEDAVAAVLGRRPVETVAARDLVAVYDDPAWVRGLDVDPRSVAGLGRPLCVTAPGGGADFVSRYFAPGEGIDEDPVTGSAHCTLAPYWGARLGKARLVARQVSPRGGELEVSLSGDRVAIAGAARPILRGSLAPEVERVLLGG